MTNAVASESLVVTRRACSVVFTNYLLSYTIFMSLDTNSALGRMGDWGEEGEIERGREGARGREGGSQAGRQEGWEEGRTEGCGETDRQPDGWTDRQTVGQKVAG